MKMVMVCVLFMAGGLCTPARAQDDGYDNYYELYSFQCDPVSCENDFTVPAGGMNSVEIDAYGTCNSGDDVAVSCLVGSIGCVAEVDQASSAWTDRNEVSEEQTDESVNCGALAAEFDHVIWRMVGVDDCYLDAVYGRGPIYTVPPLVPC